MWTITLRVKKDNFWLKSTLQNFQASVDQNRAQINNAQANLAKLNAQMVMAEKNL